MDKNEHENGVQFLGDDWPNCAISRPFPEEPSTESTFSVIGMIFVIAI
jgi:hypothetical protein